MPEIASLSGHIGFCIGGPLNFKRFQTPQPLGLIYIDPTPDVNMLWYYNWTGRVFQWDENGVTIDTSNPDFQWGVDTTGWEVVLNPLWVPA